MLEIAQVRLSDGFMRRYGSSGMDTDIGNLTDPTVEVSLLASLPSEAPAITSFIRAPDEGRTTIQSVASAGYDYRLRELVAVQRGERYLLPVGDGLVNIPHSGYTTDPAVEYVMFEDVSAGRIDLPFDSTEGGDGTIVEYALSHDGRRLYALSPYDGQIAVIDLERLEIVTFASLEDETPPASQVEGLDREELPPFYAQHPMALSPDGRYLYALGTLYPLTGGYTPGIWKIDTSTWTIVDEAAPGGGWSTLSIHSNGDGSELYVSLGLRGPSSDGEYVLESPGMLAVDTATLDDRTGLIDLGGYVVVGTLADVYRDFHGRSPTVDGVAPG
jgi:WD40 repeat protein